MQYNIDKSNGKEYITAKCDICEGCDVNMEICYTSSDFEKATKECAECEECNKHNHCDEIIWEGSLESGFLDFISLDFDAINKGILNILRTSLSREDYEGYTVGKGMSVTVNAKIDDYLFGQHFFFSLYSFGYEILHNLMFFNSSKEYFTKEPEFSKLEFMDKYRGYTSFDEFIMDTSFDQFICIQKIIEKRITDVDFYKLLSNHTDILAELNIAYAPSSETGFNDSLQEIEKMEMQTTRHNIFQRIGVVTSQVPKAPSFIEVYPIDDLIELCALVFNIILKSDRLIKKCENCGKYFIPPHKADTKYCERISPQYPTLSCKQSQKYIKQLKREHGDETERMRKNVYNLLRNKLYGKKAEDDQIYDELRNRLSDFVDQSTAWKNTIKEQPEKLNEYKEWLNSFKAHKA